MPGEEVGRIRGAGIAPKRVGRAVNAVGARLDPNVYDVEPSRKPYSALGFCWN